MSLEQALAANTAAIQALTASLSGAAGSFAGAQQMAAAVVPQAQAQQPAQTYQQQPAANGMPGAPNFGAPGGAPGFGAPQAQTQQIQVPFSDMNGLVAYSTDAWHFLEKKQPGRGAAITQTLNGMGYAQANDIPVTAYPQFFAAIEQLKAQP